MQMAQRTLFTDSPTPLQLGRQGEQRAIDAAMPEWKQAALDALYQVCLDNEVFLVDSLWRALPKDIEHPDKRAMAGILSMGVKRGWCQKTKQVERSNQRHCHGNFRTCWLSLIYKGR